MLWSTVSTESSASSELSSEVEAQPCHCFPPRLKELRDVGRNTRPWTFFEPPWTFLSMRGETTFVSIKQSPILFTLSLSESPKISSLLSFCVGWHNCLNSPFIWGFTESLLFWVSSVYKAVLNCNWTATIDLNVLLMVFDMLRSWNLSNISRRDIRANEGSGSEVTLCEVCQLNRLHILQ